jgi:hypothetical protein
MGWIGHYMDSIFLTEGEEAVSEIRSLHDLPVFCLVSLSKIVFNDAIPSSLFVQPEAEEAKKQLCWWDHNLKARYHVYLH